MSPDPKRPSERCPECLCPLCHNDVPCPSCHGRGIGASVARGLADGAAGRVVSLGDFTQYADDEETP